MSKAVASVLTAVLLWPLLALAAVRGDEVMYVGGTIPAVERETEGRLDTSDGKVMRFTSKRGRFEIPYEGITSVEYGQKAGRRLGVALVTSMWALMSKKRRHFMTIGFKDGDDQAQGVVLELPKGTPRSIIAIIEARSGVKCDYESEEARKHVHG